MASARLVAPVHHLHPTWDVCPLCDAPIPHDRAEEITARLEAREKEQSAAVTSRLTERFETDRVEALEAARLDAEQRIAAASAEARQLAEAQLKAKVDDANAAKTEAEAAHALLQGQLEKIKVQGEAALEALRAEAEASAAAIRAEAEAEAEAAAAEKIAEMATARAAAELSTATLKSELETSKLASAKALEESQAQSAAREAAARAEANIAAQEKISAAEQAKVDAEIKAVAAEAQALGLQQAHQEELDARLQEQREALEAAKTAALNAEKSAAFEDRLKLTNKVDELSRALEKKSNEELGEGAEIDLFESLKAEFVGDRIERVNKGQPGADILHAVVHNGRDCGMIIYDSKNHSAWRTEFVTKLKSDQLAAQAEHAILSTRKFPAGEKQFCIQEGVVIAGPARVVALVQLVRAHLVQTHTLRMSAEQRGEKTDELYCFITSQQCTELFNRLDEQADTLQEIDTNELRSHQAVWKKRGVAIQTVVKAQAELRNRIDLIIGTAPVSEFDG